MRQPRPLRPWRPADLVVPATALAAVAATFTLVLTCTLARDPADGARPRDALARAVSVAPPSGAPPWRAR